MIKRNISPTHVFTAAFALVALLALALVSTSPASAASCGHITGISIIDLSTGHPVDGFENIRWNNHITINLDEMPAEFNIQVETSGNVESVLGTLEGVTKTENYVPYRFPRGDHGAWNPDEGEYDFVAKAYNQDRGRGSRCDTDPFDITVNGDAPDPTPVLTPPTTPTCEADDLLWVNDIDVVNLDNRGIPVSDVRFKNGSTTQFSIPDLPAAFNGRVTIDITEAVAWDGYTFRPSTGDQPNERFKVVAVKNDVVVYESAWTGVDMDDDGLATGDLTVEWLGSLGSTTLTAGADELLLVHWADSEYGMGDGSSPNSVVPSSVCIDYRVFIPDSAVDSPAPSKASKLK